MATSWKTIGTALVRTARKEGPRLLRQLRDSPVVERGREAVRSRLAGGAEDPVTASGGRPVTVTSTPTADQARRIDYSPHLDGDADPGEIVWTWVEFEDDPSQGKDRPVLVVGRDGRRLLGLMLSSQAHRADDPNWQHIGSGSWDERGRASYARLDRVLDVPEAGIRREGAILDRARFESVAVRLRAEYGWS